MLSIAESALGEVCLEGAQWRRAFLLFESSRRHCEEIGAPTDFEQVHAARALIGFDPAAAEARLRARVQAPGAMRETDGDSLLTVQELARSLIEQHRFEEARATLESSIAGDAWPGAPYFERLRGVALAARAGAATALVREAFDELERSPAEAKAVRYIPLGFWSRLDRWWIHLALGDLAGVRADLEALAEEARAKGLVAVAEQASELANGGGVPAARP